MALISDTVNLFTGELLHNEIIEKNIEADIKPLAYHYFIKLVDNKKQEKHEK